MLTAAAGGQHPAGPAVDRAAIGGLPQAGGSHVAPRVSRLYLRRRVVAGDEARHSERLLRTQPAEEERQRLGWEDDRRGFADSGTNLGREIEFKIRAL